MDRVKLLAAGSSAIIGQVLGRNGSKKVMLVVTTAILLAAVFVIGFYVGDKTSGRGDVASVLTGVNGVPEEVDLSPFWKAWRVLDERFVAASSSEAVAIEDKVWGAIKGLTSSYNDPYTVFLPPQESEIFQEDISGSFSGVGMEIGIRNDVLTVVAPLKGTPADSAGIQPQDRIVAIEGDSTQGMTVDEAVARIRGEKGTPVILTIVREGVGQPFDKRIVRDTINIPTIATSHRADNIFVIELYNFTGQAPNLFRGALREFLATGSNKLLLDLRGNPGGFLEAAVDAASYFLPEGKVVVVENFGEGIEDRVHRSKGYDAFNEDLEMVILVNGGSASASEIVAGALQEHGVATLVGSQTFGKGSVQELVPITKDTSLKVTIARWLTPEGRTISENGLEPDIVIERTIEDVEAGRDPQLEEAVKLLLEK